MDSPKRVHHGSGGAAAMSGAGNVTFFSPRSTKPDEVISPKFRKDRTNTPLLHVFPPPKFRKERTITQYSGIGFLDPEKLT